MDKPLLIVITGRPASGKTTLAHLLSKEINCPLLSRDELKEGYLNTTGLQRDQSAKSIDWHIYETFFEIIELLVSKGVSVIVEAAYQHKLWMPRLSDIMAKADVRIIVCEISPPLAKKRFASRLSANPGRAKFHADDALLSGDEKSRLLIDAYERLNMEIPMLEVDTADHYNPGIEAIINFATQRNTY